MDTLRLKRGSALRIDDCAGTVVEVARGEVWLTQEHDPRDYFLRAGDWLRIDRPVRVVISAMGDEAWIALTELAPGHLQRLLLAPGPSLA
jgi:hypothetical protein